jgi:hypothetical protein
MRHRESAASSAAANGTPVAEAAVQSAGATPKVPSPPPKGDPVLAVLVLLGFAGLQVHLATTKITMIIGLVSLAVRCAVPFACDRPAEARIVFAGCHALLVYTVCRGAPSTGGASLAGGVWFISFLTCFRCRFPTDRVAQGFLAVNFLVPSVSRFIWPGFKSLSAWKRAKWVNLSVSLVHSSLSSVISVVALWAVYDEYIPTDNWMRVRVLLRPGSVKRLLSVPCSRCDCLLAERPGFRSGDECHCQLNCCCCYCLCLQGSQTSILPFFSIAFSNGYFAYDTWDMLQV